MTNTIPSGPCCESARGLGADQRAKWLIFLFMRGQSYTPIHTQEPEPERVRRAIRALHPEGVPEQGGAAGEMNLRELIREYVARYQQERNHQGLGSQLIEPIGNVVSLDRRVKKRERLGGMLNYFYREAA